jgi:excisionase family DNA binding protein
MTTLVNDVEAARLLGLRPATIRRMRADGRLPFVKPTGMRAVRIRVEDIEALMRPGAGRPKGDAGRMNAPHPRGGGGGGPAGRWGERADSIT